MLTSKQRYYKYRKEKRCVRCGKHDEQTLNGRSLCENCNEYIRRYQKVFRENNRKQVNAWAANYQNKRYYERLNNRLCVVCGQPLPDGYYYVHCQKCRDFLKEYKKRKKLEKC